MEQSPEWEDDRYAAVRQYSLAQILGVWAAAAVPMGVLAWIVAPWLRDQLGGDEPFAQALLICITAGLIWQFVLVLILTRRELGGLQWSRVREALWLRAPRDPKTGRVGGRVWWWVLPFVVLFALEAALGNPGTLGEGLRRFPELRPWRGLLPRSVGLVRGGRRARRLQHRARRGAALPGASAAANAGRLWKGRLGRQRGAVRASTTCISRGCIPTSLVDIFALAYPSRRFQSAWMGIIVHSAQSVVVIGVVLSLVLK